MVRASAFACCAAVLLVILASQAHGQGAGGLGAAINGTTSYVNTVNQSAYLVFYPHLAQAYGYIANASNASTSDPQYAYVLLGRARASAGAQLALINMYRTYSAYAMALATAALAAVLYMLMRPVRRGKTLDK